MAGLDAYRLDRAFTDGVEIRLDDAPDVVFLVRLPSRYNRAYSRSMYEAMKVDGEGTEVRVTATNLVNVKFVQEDAFVQHCLISIDGEPVPAGFQAEYPVAVEELVEKANALVSKIEERVEESVKKSRTTSHGNASGAAKKSSTTSLNSEVA